MRKSKLQRSVLMGLLGVSLLGGSELLAAVPAEAAPETAALYTNGDAANKAPIDYRDYAILKGDAREKAIAEAETKLQKLRAQKSAMEKESAEKEAIKAAKDKPKPYSKSSGAAVNAESEESPLSFSERIQHILDDYHHHTGDFAPKDERPEPSANDKPAPTTNPPKAAAKSGNPIGAPMFPSPEKPSIKEGRYNFDWRGTPLPQSLYGVAKIAGKGVVVNGTLEGTVYIHLNQVTCNQALDYLSRAFNFNWMTDGNNIIISDDTKMKQSETFDVRYINKANLKDEIKSLGIDEGNIYANAETGTISVTGTPYQIEETKKRLERLDHPVAQCLLLAQLIEVNHGKSRDLGFQYSLPTYSHEGSEDADGSVFKGNWGAKLTFSATSSAARELSKGKVIARPMVMSLNGQEGTVEFGDEVPVLTKTDTGSSTSVTVTYQSIGTKLTMTPTINTEDSEITLKLSAEVSNIAKWSIQGDTRAPQMTTRKTTTSAHLKSGQSFVIGGLMTSNDLDNLSGIPGLMNLPILGELFRYHSHSRDNTEVYIMITPYIVDSSVDPNKIYQSLKKSDQKITDAQKKNWEATDYVSSITES